MRKIGTQCREMIAQKQRDFPTTGLSQWVKHTFFSWQICCEFCCQGTLETNPQLLQCSINQPCTRAIGYASNSVVGMGVVVVAMVAAVVVTVMVMAFVVAAVVVALVLFLCIRGLLYIFSQKKQLES